MNDTEEVVMAEIEFTAAEAERKAEFRQRGKRLFGRPGQSWTTALAGHFGINDRKVRSWAAEPPASWRPVPEWLLDEMRAIPGRPAPQLAG